MLHNDQTDADWLQFFVFQILGYEKWRLLHEVVVSSYWHYNLVFWWLSYNGGCILFKQRQFYDEFANWLPTSRPWYIPYLVLVRLRCSFVSQMRILWPIEWLALVEKGNQRQTSVGCGHHGVCMNNQIGWVRRTRNKRMTETQCWSRPYPTIGFYRCC